MTLTAEEKARNKRERMIEKAREYSTGTYINRFVSPVFQQMIRAEAAARPSEPTPAIVRGEFVHVLRRKGECVCVTCGKTAPWKGTYIGGGIIETGHFLQSRRASILFEETGANPQCKHCNRHLGGNEGNYRLWMTRIHGTGEIERLERLKRTVRKFTREELVDMRIKFAARLKAAKERMGVAE